MSPHILIDEALESLHHPAAMPGEFILVQRIINKMMADTLITLEEFSHYSQRLTNIQRGARRAA